MADIAVLGCGPAGLLAAHAVVASGHTPVILAHGGPSRIGGAQYIHESIPELGPVPGGDVVYKQVGDRAGYAKKVYGTADAEVSWDRFPPGHYPVWSMKHVYETLWNRYAHLVEQLPINFEVMVELNKKFEHVISSIPLQAICGDHNAEHSFERQRVWIDYGPASLPGPNVIIYNGDPQVGWYRYSRLFDWHGWEWSFDPTVDRDLWAPMHEIQVVDKPLTTDCNCWSEMPGVTLVGRYGKWQKNVLAHEAYVETRNVVGWL